jgi:hypothetical protein
VQDVAGQHLRVAPGGMRAPRLIGDRGQRDVSVHLHRAVEEAGEVLPGEFEDSPLCLDEFADEAEVDRVEPVAPANGSGVQVFAKGLARLVMLGQPVAGPRGGQRVGQGSQRVFQLPVRLHSSPPPRQSPPS